MQKKTLPNLIIGITGASGSIYALKLLQYLYDSKQVNTHLIISKSAAITIKQELNVPNKELIALADYHYNYHDIGASIASGSFKTMGMIILPCSIKTMSEIATGNTSNLLSRAADVTLKEQRKLLISLRETPLHYGHLDNLKKLSLMGAVIAPPVPAFYTMPKTIDDIVSHTIGRILDNFNITNSLTKEWQGSIAS